MFPDAQTRSFINVDGTIDEFVAKNDIDVSDSLSFVCGIRMQTAKDLVQILGPTTVSERPAH